MLSHVKVTLFPDPLVGTPHSGEPNTGVYGEEEKQSPGACDQKTNPPVSVKNTKTWEERGAAMPAPWPRERRREERGGKQRYPVLHGVFGLRALVV